VERTGLRGVLPARSAPRRAAVPSHLGPPPAFCVPKARWHSAYPACRDTSLKKELLKRSSASFEKREGVEEQRVFLCSCSSIRQEGGLCCALARPFVWEDHGWVLLCEPPSPHQLFRAATAPGLHCTKIPPLATGLYLTLHAPATTPTGALPSLFPQYDAFFCLQTRRRGSNALPSTLLKGPEQASQSSARTYCKCFQTPAESAGRQGVFF